jgi:amino acid adenylation domain-containing protein
MNERVDGGDILKQRCFPIEPSDTALTLNAKCYEAAVHAFSELLDELEDGRATPQPQSLEKRVFFPKSKRPPAAGIISWSGSAEDIDALVRALQFGPYANQITAPKFAAGNGFTVVSRAEIRYALSSDLPGTVTMIDQDAIVVATGSNEIALRELLTIDGEPVSIPTFVASSGLREGDRLLELDQAFTSRITTVDKKLCLHESFWVTRLLDLRAADLPRLVRKTKGARGTSDHTTLPMKIPSDLLASLQATIPERRLGNLIIAVYAAYLARITDNFVFDLGLVDDNSYPQLDGLEALFATVLPLRVSLTRTCRFRDAAQIVGKELETIRSHITYARDVGARYQELRAVDRRLPLSVEFVADSGSYSRSTGPLALIIPENGPECLWSYDPALVDGDGVATLSRMFVDFAVRLVTHPDVCLAEVPLISERENDLIVVEWNQTATDYRRDSCIHELFEMQARTRPEAIAAVSEGREITYSELDQRAGVLAHRLRQLGVRPETVVSICVPRSIEMLIGLLGILKAGGAYLPLDPALPDDRVHLMLTDSQCRFVVIADAGDDRPSFRELTRVHLDQMPRSLSEPEVNNFHCGPTSENLAYVIYTSGSSGQPKGCMVPHRGAVNWLVWMVNTFAVTSDDRVLQKASPGFDVSVLECFLPLITGGRVVLAASDRGYDAAYLSRLIVQENITLAQFVPSMMSVLLETSGLKRATRLRHVFSGGEVLSAKLQSRFFEGSTAEICNCYGPTEASIAVSMWACRRGDTREHVPIGRPIANTQLYILDGNMQPVPIGVPGELYIGGDPLGRGYLNRPDLTACKFVPNPFATSQGSVLYRTGDVARYLSDGNIEYLGRDDDQVKIQGVRIELGEIETLFSQHPEVNDAVIGVYKDTSGASRLVAYWTPRTDRELERSELCAFLKKSLPQYMVPSIFMKLSCLPMTPNGKVDRRALPSPKLTASSTDNPNHTYVPPRDEWEATLAGIWEKVLAVSPLGVTANFFELGGDSLSAITVMCEIEAIYGGDIPLSLLFRNSTIEGVAATLRNRQSFGRTSPLVPFRANGSKPPFFLGGSNPRFADLARLLGPDQPVYALDVYMFQEQQLTSGNSTCTDIGAIANYFTEQIQALQPRGPYFLGGGCEGGIVALEIATQLQQRGQEVAMLAMLDTAPVSRWPKNDLFTLARASRALRYLVQHGPKALGIAVFKRITRAGSGDAARRSDHADQHRQIQRSIEQAIKNYHQAPYHGRVVLLRASERLPDSPDSSEGWDLLASEGTEIHLVPGNHLTCLDVHFREVAETLKLCLDKARRNGG